MNTFIKIDINIFALVICACMFVFNFRMSEKKHLQNRLFRLIIVVTMLLLAMESLFFSLNGQAGANLLLNMSAAAIYSLVPLPSVFWALYASYQLYHDSRRLKTEITLLSIPFGVNALLSFTSPLTGLIFMIGSDYLHHRGPLLLLMVAISLIPLAYTAVLYILQRKNVTGKVFLPMILFSAILAAGAVLQVVFEPFPLYYVSLTLAIFVIHTSVQNKQFHLDHLTGLYNRRQLDSHIMGRISASRKGGDFSCIMLDIDNFKEINDCYGHIAGDEALKEASRILKASIRSSDFLARYAGDEFVIVFDISDEQTLQKTIARINENAAQFSRQMLFPYKLSFSVGYNIYRQGSGITHDEFIAGVDARMYRDKNNKKAAAARDKCRRTIAQIKNGSYSEKTASNAGL